MVYALELYPDGLLRFTKVGLRAFCSRVDPEQLTRLRSLADPERVEKLKWSQQAGADARMAQILAGHSEVRIVLDGPPQAVRPLLRAVDTLFTKQFGRRYDMPLLSDARDQGIVSLNSPSH